MDKRTGKELEFELFSGIYYGEEEEDDLGIVEVIIDGAVDFSEMFPFEDEPKIMRQVRKRYRDIIEAIRKECDKFVL
jgi:hypothetical protein